MAGPISKQTKKALKSYGVKVDTKDDLRNEGNWRSLDLPDNKWDKGIGKNPMAPRFPKKAK
jgi:hypothetical protein